MTPAVRFTAAFFGLLPGKKELFHQETHGQEQGDIKEYVLKDGHIIILKADKPPGLPGRQKRS